MKHIFKPLVLAIGLAFLVFACDGAYDSLVNTQEENNPMPSIGGDSGNADFTKLVTIGNSLTAGFKDGALYDFAQQNSLGAQLARQMSFAGGSATFNQPNINSANGFNSAASNIGQGIILGRFKLDTSIPGPSPVIGGQLPTLFDGDRAALNNFGVPGIQVGQLLSPDTGNPSSPLFNPLYARFASAPGSTILGDAIAANPTFFTLWIGNNDVLGFALSGASNPAILTSQADFTTRFSTVINQLMTNTTAKGLVADIPALLFAPYFRAVPYNAVRFGEADAGQVAQLNAAFSGFNMALAGLAGNGLITSAEADRRKVQYVVGPNPVLINDPGLEDLGPKFDMLVQAGAISPEQRAALQPYVQARPMTVSQTTGPEILLLPAASVLGRPADPSNPLSIVGVVVPLANQFHLTSAQIVQVETARQTFNAIIKNVVQAANGSGQPRLALYETNATSSSFAKIWGLDGSSLGIRIGGATLLPDFSPNGVFSTDGIHPNSRGVAVVVNDMISIINNTFNASVPEINILSLPGVQLCAGDCVSQQGTVMSMGIDFSHIPLN
jgi:hypothetical protein